MRYIRYASIAIFAVALILIALANRTSVMVKVLPDELAGLAALNPSYEVPLFIVIYGGILAGLIVGFIWEWIREAKERAEVKRLKGEKHEGKDEVLAILEQAS